MPKFRKRPVAIEAVRWFKNGDGPMEGQLVRRYRNPWNSGDNVCAYCNNSMHDHGWINALEGGHRICPRDWIIRGVAGEYYPCKPDIFEATYEPVEED